MCCPTRPVDLSSEPQGEGPQPKGFMDEVVPVHALWALEETEGHEAPGAEDHAVLLQPHQQVRHGTHEHLQLRTRVQRQVSEHREEQSFNNSVFFTQTASSA